MKYLSGFKKIICLLPLLTFLSNPVLAGITVTQSDGMRFTGADGIDYFGTDGLRFTGADGFISTRANGLRFTGADGVPFTGMNGTRFTGADGVTYIGENGLRFTGADGIDLGNVDGMRFTGADGFRFTGADGTLYKANSLVVTKANGVSLKNPSGVFLTGLDGLRFTGADGTAILADGMRFTGADQITLTGADSITGIGTDGIVFNLVSPAGITITGLDGMRFTGADTVFTVLDGLRFTGADGIRFTGADEFIEGIGLQSVDTELALKLNQLTDDSNVNAVVVFHQYPGQADLNSLRQIGILGGTLFRKLPMIYVTGTKRQLAAVSLLSNVRSIYGNRTLKFDSDSYFKMTQVSRVAPDQSLRAANNGLPVTGKNVTVAVLDTGVNALHNDLNGKVVQNVKLLDLQSIPLGFNYPLPIENLPNTDLISGHGTFVSGIIAGSGSASNGKYNGVAPGAKILGLSAGDMDLIYVLSGFDYLLQKGANYNVRVVNCSFSAETIYDYNDPVNIATKLLTENGVNVVFSAGNTGSGNGTINPYSVAPWVISVGATDEKGVLADFSSRGVFGDPLFKPSLVAPGVNVVSLRSLGTQTGTLGLLGADYQRLSLGEIPFYTTASGTSFTAPQVSGAIALMLEANPNLSPKDIKGILQRSATPMPNYFAHEVGAGMLNTYAAVLEAAFPQRATGIFRAELEKDTVKFSTSTMQITSDTPVPANSMTSAVNIFPENLVQSSFYIAWPAGSQNDLNLSIFDVNGSLSGKSARSNPSGFFGRNEKVTISLPASDILTTQIISSSSSLSTQSFLRASDYTQVDLLPLSDISDLSPQDQAFVREAMRKYLVMPVGAKFSLLFSVSRVDLAAALVRTGKVPQFVASSPAYSDVLNLTYRNPVESVQFNPAGKLFYDVSTGGQFSPNQPASRLVAAVALVKAAQLDNLAASSALPPSVADANSIPANLRGYAAVALQKGWLTLSNNNFDPNGALTRLDLARATVGLCKF